jgi:glutathione peroxidase
VSGSTIHIDPAAYAAKDFAVKSKLFLLAAVIPCILCLVTTSYAASNLYDIPLKDIEEKPATLAKHRGEVMLIVNVASRCGHTPQYKGLETLYQKFKDEGLVVLGFPCNQFGQQEPGSNAEIKEFCSLNYAVTFPLFDKVNVNGEDRHPLYAVLAGSGSPFPGDIEWNFGKFLVGRDGEILQRFAPNVSPDSLEVEAAIKAALTAKGGVK